jgi:UDP:flavonoid glycosyltransferase YjiC (YdhE family)
MKKILVCPLDWGIGHASRCVPVIRLCLEQGFEVVIGADGRPLELLKKEFPSLHFIRFPGARITYFRKAPLALAGMLMAPKFLLGVWHERRFLAKLLRRNKFDAVISDNRYGMRNKKCRSVIILHQLNIILPEGLRFLSGFVNRTNRRFIRKFDECWIPDFELHGGLAGRLSHPAPADIPCTYIGALSRFSDNPAADDEKTPVLDILVTLSGPEPQRTLFETKVFNQLGNSNLRGIIVRGLTESDATFDLTPNIRVYSHLPTERLQEVMQACRVVISRSGYSSLMDIVTAGKRAIFVPTPGQTEQEYLARFMMDKKIFFSMSQEEFDLVYAMEMVINYHGIRMQNDYQVLKEKIRFLAR